MKDKKSSKNTTFIFIILIVIALLVYFYFKGSPDDSSISQLEGDFAETSEASIAGAKVLSLLDDIQSIQLDTSVFESPLYSSLVDYTIAIPDQSIGRYNPFAPIGN